MKPLFSLLILALTLFCAYYNSSNSKKYTPKSDSIASPTVNQSERLIDTVKIRTKALLDSTITINFPELSLNIKRLILFEDSITTKETKSDAITLIADLGETIEGQHVSITTNELADLKLEQRYETSVSIENEGPHCDLLQWKHYYSGWESLAPHKDGQFICSTYNESERSKFPDVSIKGFRVAVRKHCGQDWNDLIKNIKSVKEAPSFVGISRYFLRIRGKRKISGEEVIKLIIIETPMGC